MSDRVRDAVEAIALAPDTVGLTHAKILRDELAAYGRGFGWALVRLKEGKRVARAGWNGKGMWLVLVRPYEPGTTSVTWDFADDNTTVTLGPVKMLPWIGMKTADDCFVPWLASQTDMLAEDWEVVA